MGDTIEVLNLGGILGRCTSVNPEIGAPFKAEVLGAILAFPELGDRVGRPAHIRDRAVPPADALESRVPVVYVAGTCMNAGKTVAATELVRGLARSGLRVAAAKLTGVSLMRDALSMLDAGAVAALTFNDVGIASTHAGVTVSTAKGIFNRLAALQAGRDRRRAGRRDPRASTACRTSCAIPSSCGSARRTSWRRPIRWPAGARPS